MMSTFEEKLQERLSDLRASFDAAQTTHDNERHWMSADAMAAHAAASPDVRATLRQRSRYECLESNPYGVGLVRTLAMDCVGTGPVLRLSVDPDFLPRNRDARKRIKKALRKVEKAFAKWARVVKLRWKLHTLRLSKAVSGEFFAVFSRNPPLSRRTGGISLDIRTVEADQVATPDLDGPTPNHIDGIHYDNYGNVTAYDILKLHPGTDQIDDLWTSVDYDTFDARFVAHGYNELRDGQLRGIPEVTSALPLFASLRRYTAAVIAAAETAASISGVIQTTASAIEPDDVAPMDRIMTQLRQFLTLPRGWGIEQIKAEQPATTFPMFRRQILSEIGRCVLAPYNVTAGDSSDHNYASGRLDMQVYRQSILVEREYLSDVVLDPAFEHWLKEAFIRKLIPSVLVPLFEQDAIEIGWYWPGFGHVDPQKEAAAQAQRLKNGTSNRTIELAALGIDIEEHDRQAAIDFGFGDDIDAYKQSLASAIFNMDVATDDEDDEPSSPSMVKRDGRTQLQRSNAA